MAVDYKFDAIVIGSGPGGATVARELAQRKKKVLILEWGDHTPIRGNKTFALNRAGVPFRSILFTYHGLSMIRGITAGGSSVFYYGTCTEPPYEMFAKCGIDLKPEVEELKRELPHEVLPDSLIGPMAQRIMETAQGMGINWQKLPKFIDPAKCRPDCNSCAYGCMREAKWNSRMFIADAQNNGAVFISRAKASRVLKDGKKAIGVEFENSEGMQKVFGDNIILSAGGIGTPLLLRNSGIKNAGINFFFDPLITVMGTVNDFNATKEIPMSTGIVYLDEGFLLTDQALPRFLWAGFSAQALRFDRIIANPYAHLMSIMVKGKDSLGGYLTDYGGIRKRLADVDQKRLLEGVSIARKILQQAGAKSIYEGPKLAAHPGGTARINDVVDHNLQTEYEHLYVCDCSVIPEPWGLPPVLTLLALGKRLGKHLAGYVQT